MSITLGGTVFAEEAVEGVAIDGYLDASPISWERGNPRVKYQVRLSNGQSQSFWQAATEADPETMAAEAFAELTAHGFTGVAYAVNSSHLVPRDPSGFVARKLGLDDPKEALWVVSSAWVRPGTATWVRHDSDAVEAGLPGGGFVHAYDPGESQFFGSGVTDAWLG